MQVRMAVPADGESLAAVYAPAVEGSAISFEYDAPDGDEMRRRLAATVPRYPWLVAEEDGTVTGYAYGHPFSERPAYGWSVETSVYVKPAHHRTGTGRALYTALFRVRALQGYIQAFAGVALPNPASIGMHEAMGFEPCGVYRKVGWKLGAWHDVGWWQRPITGDVGHPDAPLAITDLDAGALRAALG